MSTPKKLVRIATGTLAFAISAAVSATDLLEVYQLARASDPQLAVADARRLAADKGVAISRATLLPQINGTYGFTRTDVDASIFNPNGPDAPFSSLSRDRDAVLQGTQSIYRHRNYLDLKAARAQKARGISDYDAAVDNLLFRVAEAYFGVLTAQTNLASSEAEEKAVGRQLEQAEQRFEVGLSAITDVHEARARFDSARAAVIQSRNALDDAYEALSELTGKRIETIDPLRTEIELSAPQPDDAEQWVSTAITNSPALAAKEDERKAADYAAKSAWSEHLPYLDFSARYSDRTNLGDVAAFSLRDPQVFSMQLLLTVPLFTGGATQARYRQAVFNRDAADELLEQTRRATVRQTRNAYRAVIAGISEVEARTQALVSAASALEATEAGFEVGTRTIVDVLLSQQQKYAAEREYARARHAYILANLQLKQVAGTIDVGDIERVDRMLE